MKKAVRKKAPAKKKAIRKTARAARKKPVAVKKAAEPKPIGQVTHYYNKIRVAIVRFKRDVRVGTHLRFRGTTTDFALAVTSMQFNHQPVQIAKKNKLIGIRVSKRVREGDQVFLEGQH